MLDISILGLVHPGAGTVARRQVTDTGYIDLPQLNAPIKAGGMTQAHFTAAVDKAYVPNILKNPTVAVTVIARRQTLFSVLDA